MMGFGVILGVGSWLGGCEFPANPACLGSPCMEGGELGGGQPEGPEFPKVDGREELWAQGTVDVDFSLLPMFPGSHVS